VPQTDLPVEALRAYSPDLTVPADLDAFWSSTLGEARQHDLAVSRGPVDTGLAVVDSFDVNYAGYGGAPIRAWLHLPVGRAEPLPAVVEYHGYGGGRGLPHEGFLYAAAGYAHLVMDTRGQGSTWSIGDTPDPDGAGAPFHPGFMTQGILNPATYYYRRVFTDAVRAVDAVRTLHEVDPTQVVVTGRSQGGGISLAVASLVPDLLGTMPDVPFLTDFPRAITFADTDPYCEIVRYLKAHRDHADRALETLSYFDVAILGRWAQVPALFSVGLMDQICPPSTVYAAYNAYGGPKQVREYPFNDHEGGEGFHDVVKLAWLKERFSG
jgi:cephalosporin-C deacetylase